MHRGRRRWIWLINWLWQLYTVPANVLGQHVGCRWVGLYVAGKSVQQSTGYWCYAVAILLILHISIVNIRFYGSVISACCIGCFKKGVPAEVGIAAPTIQVPVVMPQTPLSIVAGPQAITAWNPSRLQPHPGDMDRSSHFAQIGHPPWHFLLAHTGGFMAA